MGHSPSYDSPLGPLRLMRGSEVVCGGMRWYVLINAVVSAVVCGGMWWYVVVCGGMWWY